MKSRSNLKRTLAAVVAGVLIGGGVTTVTPAGAEVSQFAATNWKKIWKKKLQPLADKRYYTKAASNARYAAAGSAYSKAEVDAKLGGYYTKAQSDAKYQPAGSYAAAGSSYTKAESDAKYAPAPNLIRGAFELTGNAAAAGHGASDDISFGVTLSAAPTVRVVPPGGPVPTGCSGTLESPNASAGFLCIFQRANFNVATSSFVVCTVSNNCSSAPNGTASPFGAWLFAFSTAAGYFESGGSWALRPAALNTTSLAPSGASVQGGPGGGS